LRSVDAGKSVRIDDDFTEKESSWAILRTLRLAYLKAAYTTGGEFCGWGGE
jgi:hypothetical protein